MFIHKGWCYKKSNEIFSKKFFDNLCIIFNEGYKVLFLVIIVLRFYQNLRISCHVPSHRLIIQTREIWFDTFYTRS